MRWQTNLTMLQPMRRPSSMALAMVSNLEDDGHVHRNYVSQPNSKPITPYNRLLARVLAYLSSVMTMSAACLVTSEPFLPMAMPTSARLLLVGRRGQASRVSPVSTDHTTPYHTYEDQLFPRSIDRSIHPLPFASPLEPQA